jgi:hypothetical protein
MPDVYRRELRVRPQRLASGEMKHPRRAPTTFGTASYQTAYVPYVGERKRGRQSNLQKNCLLMRLLAKSSRAGHRRPAQKSTEDRRDSMERLPASAARRTNNGLAGGGRAYRQNLAIAAGAKIGGVDKQE